MKIPRKERPKKTPFESSFCKAQKHVTEPSQVFKIGEDNFFFEARFDFKSKNCTVFPGHSDQNPQVQLPFDAVTIPKYVLNKAKLLTFYVYFSEDNCLAVKLDFDKPLERGMYVKIVGYDVECCAMDYANHTTELCRYEPSSKSKYIPVFGAKMQEHGMATEWMEVRGVSKDIQD